jgi:hypothetical protein
MSSLIIALALLSMTFTVAAMALDVMLIKGARKDEPHPIDQSEKISDEEFAMFMEKVDSGMSVPDAMEEIWGEN